MIRSKLIRSINLIAGNEMTKAVVQYIDGARETLELPRDSTRFIELQAAFEEDSPERKQMG